MSEYYAKMRQHLLEVAQSLVCDDVIIYLRKEEDRSYGVLFHKPTSSVMSIGYEGVFGISATPLHLKLNLSYQGLFFVLSAQDGAVQFREGPLFFTPGRRVQGSPNQCLIRQCAEHGLPAHPQASL